MGECLIPPLMMIRTFDANDIRTGSLCYTLRFMQLRRYSFIPSAHFARTNLMDRGVTHMQRLRITIRGAVQGVGFRPFVFRLARRYGIHGWVLNSAQGVFIETEGTLANLEAFLSDVQSEKPPHAHIQSLETSYLDPVGYVDFVIRNSEGSGEISTLVVPDIATCPDCLSEIFGRRNRRYLYPFTNCTNCGPRFTIIEELPYDRPYTTMRGFEMCDECQREYSDPNDRRFHAQPNACPVCGPHVELWDQSGRILAHRHDAIQAGTDVIRTGGILAVKGIGGFHLMTDARNDDAVRRLRHRKHREEKPLALMYPSLESVKRDCEISTMEERLLLSPESPIVLVEKKTQFSDSGSHVTESVAPANPYLGVMVAYSPLHHILTRELGFPVVATSGNLSDEPICIDEREAITRLSGIADRFLVHNRPIARHVDDSIVRIMMGREMIVRRARGYAPLPVRLSAGTPKPMIGVGAHLKNAIALKVGPNVFVSQHIGDLETQEAFDAFLKVVGDLQRLYDVKPEYAVCDLHPDYLSSKYARELPVQVHAVQHHYAHVVSCMAENELEGRVLGVAWDGTGYGADGTVWGGEFLVTTEEAFERVATFRPFKIPGGDAAIKEPRRAAVGVLYEILGDSLFESADVLPVQTFDAAELAVIRRMLGSGVNAPVTSSAGRLFDAVASIIGIRQRVGFEGQAAMELEYLLPKECPTESYPFRVVKNSASREIPKPESPYPQTGFIIDWSPIFLGILDDVRRGSGTGVISAKFHNSLTEAIVWVARGVGESRVVLSGGCFQNKYLTEHTILRLRAEGFRPYWHQRVPPNDGGIALGQVHAVMRKLNPMASTTTESKRPGNNVSVVV